MDAFEDCYKYLEKSKNINFSRLKKVMKKEDEKSLTFQFDNKLEAYSGEPSMKFLTPGYAKLKCWLELEHRYLSFAVTWFYIRPHFSHEYLKNLKTNKWKSLSFSYQLTQHCKNRKEFIFILLNIILKIKSRNDIVVEKELIEKWINNPGKAGKQLESEQLNNNEICRCIEKDFEAAKKKNKLLEL